MREVDAETPVVWPAWCYSGGAEQPGSIAGGGSLGVRVRAPARRRAPAAHNGTPREHPAHMNSSPHELNHNNNNIISSIGSSNPILPCGIKNERLSPQHNANDRSSSRSRSVTPSTCSFPGTPPQGGQSGAPALRIPPIQLTQPIQLIRRTPMRSPPHALARNYSEFMRNLAAKYNNTNPNDFFNASRPHANGLSVDPRGLSLKVAPFAGLLAPPPPAATSQHQLSSSSAQQQQVPQSAVSPPPTRQVAGLFAGYSLAQGGPRTLAAFPPMLDMSSTKALLAIARVANAAKEAEMTNSFMKGAVKRPPVSTTSENPLSSPLDLSSASIAAVYATSSSKKLRLSPKNEPGNMNESGSSSAGSYGERSPADRSNSNNKSINGCDATVKCEKSACARSEAASPGSSGRKSPGSSRECGSCYRGEHRRDCGAASSDPEVAGWGVDDVCKFVESIDICAEYSPMFREQSIDGSGLPLLTEDHLTGQLRMKLGPALKMRAMLTAKLGGCHHCRCNPSTGGATSTGSNPNLSASSTGVASLKIERPPSAGSDDS